MKLNLLYFDRCPSWQQALTNMRTAITEEKLDASIQIIKVTTDQESVEQRFLGSPSFQVDGVDFWPTVEMLRQKLMEKSGLEGSANS